MLSRVAESIYWMARHVERAENTARLVNVNINLMLDLPRKARPGWEVLIEIMGSEQLFGELYKRSDERSVIKFLLCDMRNPGSMLASLRQARENARTIRDIIPREAWEQLNGLYHEARDNQNTGLSQKGRYQYLRSVILGAQTVTGILAGTMTQDHGYGFLRMGRNLERADMTTRIIDVRAGDLMPVEADGTHVPYENLQWMSVLKSLTGYQMYRREMQVRVQRPAVLRFLLKDARFPRALKHCLGQAHDCLTQLPRSEQPLKIAKRVIKHVDKTEIDALEPSALHEFIDVLQFELAEVNNAISATYFRHEPPRKITSAAARS